MRVVLSECLLERCASDEVISDVEEKEEKLRKNRNSKVPHFPTLPPSDMLVREAVWPGAVHEGSKKSE